MKKLSNRLQALIADGEIPLSDAWGKLIDDLKATEEQEPVNEATDWQVDECVARMESEGDMVLVPRGLLGAALGAIRHPKHESGVTMGSLRHYAYKSKCPEPQPAPDNSDREMLKRLAVILSGSDAPGEIRSLTVTAQSFVDRCKTLAKERGNLPVIPDGWKIVPVDATRAMIDAARRVEEDGYDAMHKAMLSAAPKPEKQ